MNKEREYLQYYNKGQLYFQPPSKKPRFSLLTETLYFDILVLKWLAMVTVTFRFLRVRLMLAHESSRKRTLTESCVLILGIDLNSLFVTINL